MGRSKKPKYGTVTRKGRKYFRTRITIQDGTRVTLYGRTESEVDQKVAELRAKVAREALERDCPTVAQYAQLCLENRSPFIALSTFDNYAQTIKKHIVEPLGDKLMCDVTRDDILAAVRRSAVLSESTYGAVQMFYKSIFGEAVKNGIISENPALVLPAKGGKAPTKARKSLTDEEVQILLNAVKGLPPYTFILLALYTGLRREEILALRWDSVDLDSKTPSLTVREAWHVHKNRPYITERLKSRAAYRTVPIPSELAQYLKEKENTANSEYVVCNRNGGLLSGSQYSRLWKYVTTRSTKPREYTRIAPDGTKTKHRVVPTLGERAAHNSHVIYSIDFRVTPHMLRHTYITNLIYAGVDPKTVQYLAGHENSKITMDIYAEANTTSRTLWQRVSITHSTFLTCNIKTGDCEKMGQLRGQFFPYNPQIPCKYNGFYRGSVRSTV